jgi:hypothetical protein
MTRGVDACNAVRAELSAKRAHHRAANAATLPRARNGDVVELGHHRAARGRDRIAHDTRADRHRAALVRAKSKPHEAELRPRNEQIERAGERVATAIPVHRARGAVVNVAVEKFAEERLCGRARRGLHLRARDHRDGRSGSRHQSVLATRRGSSAARIRAGIGAGRWVFRSTHT